MTSYELVEIGASSRTRHNTSTLESQPNTPQNPQDSISRRNSSRPSASNPVSTPVPEDPPSRSLDGKLFYYLFGEELPDCWAKSPAEKALLPASKHDRSFWSDYVRIRNRTNTHLNRLFDIQLSLPPSASNQTVTNRYLLVLKEYSFGQCLETLHQELQVEHTESFVVCSFAAENLKVKNFGIKFAPRLQKIPRRALVYLLSQEPNWRLSEDLLKTFREALEPEVPERSFKLPSEEASHSTFPEIIPNTVEFILYWQSKAPKYSGDWDTYIWQPLRNAPPFVWVRINVINLDNLRNLRLLLLYRNSHSLEVFRSNFIAKKESHGTSDLWMPVTAMIDTLSAVFGVLLSDMMLFLKEASKQISRIIFLSRAQPRAEKIQYLIHLDDCTRRAEHDMESNLIQLNKIYLCLERITPRNLSSHASPAGDQSSHDESFCNTPLVNDSGIISKVKADMEYVLKELGKLRRDIKGVHAEIESQNSLNSRNTTMLTFLAAVYVPLAFVTSFLGMNIIEFATPFSASSNTTNTDSVIQNPTSSSPASAYSASTSSSRGTQNPQLWKMSAFGILSGPLLFVTIILPIIMGPTIRWLFQTYLRLKRIWRLVLTLVLVTTIVAPGLLNIITPYRGNKQA